MWDLWGEEECTQNFDGKLEGKRPGERSRRRWEGNIKMDFKETEWNGMN
jgi:hypothetical protein